MSLSTGGAAEVVPRARTGWSHWLGWGEMGGDAGLRGETGAVGWASVGKQQAGRLRPEEEVGRT